MRDGLSSFYFYVSCWPLYATWAFAVTQSSLVYWFVRFIGVLSGSVSQFWRQANCKGTSLEANDIHCLSSGGSSRISDRTTSQQLPAHKRLIGSLRTGLNCSLLCAKGSSTHRFCHIRGSNQTICHGFSWADGGWSQEQTWETCFGIFWWLDGEAKVVNGSNHSSPLPSLLIWQLSLRSPSHLARTDSP